VIDTTSIRNGVLGGLAGGVVFGMMMGMMGMLPMIGAMAGYPSALFGMGVHLVISAFIGGTFAVLFGGKINGSANGLGFGLGYGAVWWFLGPLTLMPLMMGMGVNWNLAAATQMLPSLMGHLIYGALLGGVYGRLQGRVAMLAHSH